MRWSLPYGVWTCRDGREIIYDRRYRPIAQRLPGQPPSLVRDHWVTDISSRHWLYDDATPEAEKLRRAKQILTDWGLIIGQVIEHVGRRPLNSKATPGTP